MQAAERLSELENFMRAPDAIMEPSVMAKINEYLSAGGQPQVAIESLSEHYEGRDMCHLPLLHPAPLQCSFFSQAGQQLSGWLLQGT